MDHFVRDIDIELWNKVKAKATLERKTVREVIFEGLKWEVAFKLQVFSPVPPPSRVEHFLLNLLFLFRDPFEIES